MLKSLVKISYPILPYRDLINPTKSLFLGTFLTHKIILPKLTFWGDIIPLKWSKKWPKIVQ